MYTKKPATHKLHQFSRYLVIALASLLPCVDASAISQLMVAPTRVVFEGNTRTKQITLINNGGDTGRYRISFVRRKMTEDGNLVEVGKDEPGMYSDTLIRYSPRQVTLPPGQSQVVRLMLRKPRDLKDGEYRSHLMFQALPDPSSTSVTTLAGKNTSGLSIKLIPIVGITIPVIVRQGKLEAGATLSDFSINMKNQVKQQPDLKMHINRTGNASVYGDIRVDFSPNNGSKQSIVIGQANGVAVYTPNASREFTVQLQVPPSTKLANGELHITFTKHGKNAKTGLLAESTVSLP